MGAAVDFQQALVEALRGDAALVALVGGVEHIADWPNPDTQYPLVTIGEDAQNQWGMKDETKNYQVTAMIHVWSEGKGWKEAKQILDAIDNILLSNIMPMPSGSAFTIIGKAKRPDPTRTLPGEDTGRIRHLIARYDFWISC